MLNGTTVELHVEAEPRDTGVVGGERAYLRKRPRQTFSPECVVGERGEAADVGGGKALRIDHNAVAVHIASPYDESIQTLSSKINETYIGYGALGATGLSNQVAQDTNSLSYGAGSAISRAAAKSSMHYDNASWDLVDALANGDVEDASEVRDSLDGDLKDLDDEALRKHVKDKQEERAKLQKEMRELQQKRTDYVSGKKSDEANRLDTAIVESLTEQAVAAGFTL